MQYTDHPEYPKYKDMIDSILADGYPLTKEVSGNVFDTCPQLLEERFMNYSQLKQRVSESNLSCNHLF